MTLLPLLLTLLPPAAGSGIPANDIDGRRVLLPIAGKTSCLVFVATECPIANRMSPELARIATEYKEVAFFLVYPDARTTKAQIRKHVKEFNLPGTILLDPKQTVARFAKATVTPEAAVYDSNGKMVYHGRINDFFTEHNVTLNKPTKNDLRDVLTALKKGEPIGTPYVAPVGCSISFTGVGP